VVSRSSTAETRLEPTAQPPATSSAEPACRSSGTSTRANHAISSSAAVRSAPRPDTGVPAPEAAGQQRPRVLRPRAATQPRGGTSVSRGACCRRHGRRRL
jgi:hypothetical protein